ncbi:uncharacterized protein MEPE_04339 [Melanopsichium pennsylvanicum]|uniref:Uncharacterized protein n=1 Tax=Melanopsichium pennsylvanicum TaxID=63383 RepID=A0AAJ4XNN5_9BASI|nr:uncharacterized protein MEPE_04339 [Melanopsichium pennsylvanicum]
MGKPTNPMQQKKGSGVAQKQRRSTDNSKKQKGPRGHALPKLWSATRRFLWSHLHAQGKPNPQSGRAGNGEFGAAEHQADARLAKWEKLDIHEDVVAESLLHCCSACRQMVAQVGEVL